MLEAARTRLLPRKDVTRTEQDFLHDNLFSLDGVMPMGCHLEAGHFCALARRRTLRRVACRG